MSCAEQKEQPEYLETNDLIFGHFYGFCAGEQCIEIFKLTNNALYEDKNDTYPIQNNFYAGDFMKLDQSKFELVKSLREQIPDQLLHELDTVFGWPDVADGGGIYLEIKNDTIHRFWIIDQVESNIPAYLRPFKVKINQSISLIND